MVLIVHGNMLVLVIMNSASLMRVANISAGLYAINEDVD